MDRKVEKEIVKRKKFLIILSVLLLFFVFISDLIVGIPIVKIADAGDITSYPDDSTYLSLSTPKEEPGPGPGPGPGLEVEPRINWYDFQTATGVSKLNSQIDVNQEYKFCINISNDQGWDDIEYIDITAWFDNGDDSTTYNNSGNLGGNLNMFLQYENTTGIANYIMLWPNDEVTKGSFTETIATDPDGISGSTECYHLTFSFIPGYQFRYAPGDGSWDYTTNPINDVWSWNFKISVTDSGEDTSRPSTVWIIDEFGVNSYTEIVCVGVATIQGLPGENAIADRNITIETRSNGNYFLTVDLDQLDHTNHPTANMSNTTVSLRGGNLTSVTPFPGTRPLYLWGISEPSSYQDAENNGASLSTSEVEYRCNIPFGQLPGNYTAMTHYQLRTQI